MRKHLAKVPTILTLLKLNDLWRPLPSSEPHFAQNILDGKQRGRFP